MTATLPLYPLLLKPSLHVKVWGGRKLEKLMKKSLPTDEPYGESWELHDTATVMNGPLAGKTLGELLDQFGAALVGEDTNPEEGFPLLIKLLDASDWLSIQTHPNDEQAKQLEGNPRGKTEAWVILAAEPGAKLVIGAKPETTHEQLAQAIRENTLENLLAFATVRAGDVLYIPANTIHALGPGILLYEVQQASNITYRLYDWGRMGLDGQPRELHIEKGIQVANLETLPQIRHLPDQKGVSKIINCPYFQTELIALDQLMKLDRTTHKRFHALTCIEGTTYVSAHGTTFPISVGQTALIPADVDTYRLHSNENVRLLCSYQQ